MKRFAFAALLLAMASAALAVRPDERLADPKLEARAHAIGQELRCLVCQNESIEDSDADLAHDLRVLVRQRLVAGDTDDQARQYIVARYGTYVLLKPPLTAETWALWFGPILILLAAIALGSVVYSRRTRPANGVEPLSPAEKARLKALLDHARDGQS